MRNMFKEFFTTDVDFRELSDEVLIVPDTNTLLNIYRYSKETRDTFLKSLKELSTNLWMPYQVGVEFNLNRQSVMLEVKTIDAKICSSIDSKKETLKNQVKSEIEKFPIKSTDGTELRKEIINIFNIKINELIENFQKNEFRSLTNLINREDDQLKDLADIFENKVGPSYSQVDIDEICKEGEGRYSNNIPPGYRDDSKDEMIFYNNLRYYKKYGDLIIWKQIIERAKDEGINKVIFISDDDKQDWWYKIQGKKIGARAELKNELMREANSEFILMNTNTFINQVLNNDSSDLIDSKPANERYYLDDSLVDFLELNDKDELNSFKKLRENTLRKNFFNVSDLIVDRNNLVFKFKIMIKDSENVFKLNSSFIEEIDLKTEEFDIRFEQIEFSMKYNYESEDELEYRLYELTKDISEDIQRVNNYVDFLKL